MALLLGTSPEAEATQLAALVWLLVVLPFSSVWPAPLKCAAGAAPARMLPEAEMEMLLARPLAEAPHCCGTAACCEAAAPASEPERTGATLGESGARTLADSASLRAGGGVAAGWHTHRHTKRHQRQHHTRGSTTPEAAPHQQQQQQQQQQRVPAPARRHRLQQVLHPSEPSPAQAPLHPRGAPVVAGQRLLVLQNQRGQQRVQVGHVGRPAAGSGAQHSEQGSWAGSCCRC
jgi:hypothetical protein